MIMVIGCTISGYVIFSYLHNLFGIKAQFMEQSIILVNIVVVIIVLSFRVDFSMPVKFDDKPGATFSPRVLNGLLAVTIIHQFFACACTILLNVGRVAIFFPIGGIRWYPTFTDCLRKCLILGKLFILRFKCHCDPYYMWLLLSSLYLRFANVNAIKLVGIFRFASGKVMFEVLTVVCRASNVLRPTVLAFCRGHDSGFHAYSLSDELHRQYARKKFLLPNIAIFPGFERTMVFL